MYTDTMHMAGTFAINVGKIVPHEDLVIYFGGQSNEGTDPAMGSRDTSYIPSYLKTTYTNVFFWNIDRVGFLAEFNTFAAYPFKANGWGWFNQYINILANSGAYKNIYITKRAIGGTTISTVGQGDSYNRSDFYYQSIKGKAQMDSIVGVGNYDQIVLWGQCESDASTQARAESYYTNLNAFRNEYISTTGVNCPWIIKRMSNTTKDFTYISQVQRGQDSLQTVYPTMVRVVNTNNIRHGGFAVRNPVIGNGDFSHYATGGHIAVGNKMADATLKYFKRHKKDFSRPYLLSANITTTGDSLILKYSQNINPGVVPFSRQFTVSTKVFTSVSISNDTIILKPTVPFYSGITYTLDYAPDSFFVENVQDFDGNNAERVTARAITNGCTITQPTITTLYTSNFTAGLGSSPADLPNFWTGVNGCTVTPNITSPSGVANTVRMTMVIAGANRFYKWQTSLVAGSVYRVQFNIEVPDTYSHPCIPTSIYMVASTLGTGFAPTGAIFDFTHLIYRDRMQYVEYQFTNTASPNDDWFFEISSCDAESVYIKDVIIQRVGS